MTDINGSTRKLIRDLVGLSAILENLDRIANLEQAEQEIRARVEKAQGEAAAARLAADKAIEQAQAQADAAKLKIKAEIDALTETANALRTGIEQATEERETVLLAVADAEAKLQDANDSLTAIARKFGG